MNVSPHDGNARSQPGPVARRRARSIAVGLLALAAGGTAALRGEEPAQAFVDALVREGLTAQAVEYLSTLEASGLAPEGYAEEIPFQRAIVLHQASKLAADQREKQTALAEAEKLLDDFLKKFPNVEISPRARKRLGDVLVDRAHLLLSQAERKPETLPAAQASARQLFDRARDLFVATSERLRAVLKEALKTKPDESTPTGAKTAARIADYKADFLQSLLLGSVVLSEKADTYPTGSKERKEIYASVIKELTKTADDYRSMGIGPYARYYKGKAEFETGNVKDGVADMEEVIETASPVAELRPLVLSAAALLSAAYLDDAIKLPNQAVEVLTPVVDAARPSEAEDVDLAVTRYHLARAYKQEADNKAVPRPKAGQYLSRARGMAFASAKVRSPVQKAVQAFLAQIGGPETAADGTKVAATYLDAEQMANDAVAELSQASQALEALTAKLAAAPADQRQALQAEVAAMRTKVGAAADKTMASARRAIELSDKGTSPDQLNVMRYYITYVSYVLDHYQDAAAVAEFLINRYPESPSAKATIGILLTSYRNLVETAPDKPAANAALKEVAERIATVYQGSPDAESALVQLISLAMGAKDVPAAVGYLDRLPESSPQRGQVELVVGRTLWTDYLDRARTVAGWEKGGVPEGKSLADEKARLEAAKKRAYDVLSKGVARMRAAGKSDTTLAVATLSLARMEIDLGRSGKAIELLEDPKFGPLTLARADAPIIKAKPEVGLETYRVALPAYLTAMASSPDPAALAAKAQGVMDQLERATGTTPEGKAALLTTYQALARSVQTQLEATPAGERAKLANAFGSFLEQVAKAADSFGNLNWAADTFLAIGRGITPEGTEPGPDAVAALDKAAAIYERVLADAAAKGPNWLDPKVIPLVRSRLAEVRREQGKTDEALAILTAILKENPVLSVQREAALTLEDAAAKDPALYLRAVLGGTEKDDRKEIGGKPNPGSGRPIIWGWLSLSSRLVRYASPPRAGEEDKTAAFRSLFHEARYHIALCYYKYAMTQADAAEKTKNLTTARRAVQTVHLQYPEMGGAEWRDKYEAVLRDIQKALGEPVKGFEAFAQPSAPTEAPATATAG